jgi:hypothetical protein
MIKNKIVFEIKKEDRVYSFFCDPESPLGEIFDVLSSMRSMVLEKLKEVEKQNTEKKDCDECK